MNYKVIIKIPNWLYIKRLFTNKTSANKYIANQKKEYAGYNLTSSIEAVKSITEEYLDKEAIQYN